MGCWDKPRATQMRRGAQASFTRGSSKISGCQEAAAQRSFLADRGAKANGQEEMRTGEMREFGQSGRQKQSL